jgi:hypothetical protein
MVGKKVELRAVEVVALRAVWKVELMGWLMVGLMDCLSAAMKAGTRDSQWVVSRGSWKAGK